MASGAVEVQARVDPRITRTRKLIRDALTSLLSQKKFESISVQDIAERATVNRATFYAHYADKFALLDALVREDVAAQLAQGDPLRARDVQTMLTAVGDSIFAFVARHHSCKIDPDFEQQFERAVEAELTAFLQPAFSECTAMLIASALVGAAMHWRRSAPKSSATPVVANVVGILAQGVKHRQHRDHRASPSAP